MKRSFIRVLWGEQPEPYYDFGCIDKPDEKVLDLKLRRRIKINNDIRKTLKRSIQLPFVTYIFGKNNYEQINKLGLECKLMDEKNSLYGKHQYKHKLDAFVYAMEDFDEIIFLDWDTKLEKELPSDFWEQMYQKDIFQASLWKYEISKVKHRNRNANKYCPSGGFVYIRNKSIPKRLIELWEDAPNKWSEEPSFALLTDELMNGWKGLKEYWDRFEPDCYSARKSPYRFDSKPEVKDLNKNKDKLYFSNKGKPWSF